MKAYGSQSVVPTPLRKSPFPRIPRALTQKRF